MEKSMLLYSQTMRDISERKSSSVRKPPKPFHVTTNDKSTTTNNDQSIRNKVSPIPSRFLPSIGSVNSKLSDKPDKKSTRIGDSGLSLDSGISIDSNCASSRASYQYSIWDSENSQNKESSKKSNRNDRKDEIVLDNSSGRSSRARPRKSFRDSKTFKFMPSVEKEVLTNEDIQSKVELDEEIETPRIAPFPDELIQNYFDNSHSALASIMENEDSHVGGSIVGRKNKRGAWSKKSKTKTRYVLFRPKVSHSSNLAALRHRLFRRFGPRSIYFRYSEEVLEALKILSNSSHPSPSSQEYCPVSSPTLHGLDLEELLEAHSLRPGGLFRLFMEEEDAGDFFLTKDIPKLPTLSRERSTSVPSSKGSRQSFVSKLEQVDENDNILKSVLKNYDESIISSSTHSNSNGKKNVQFFLPDVFL